MLSLDNEWKTRYQTQHQINEQLEKQRIMLQDKLENFRDPAKNGKYVVYKRFPLNCMMI